MKTNPFFEKSVANVAPEVMAEVNLNVDIANRISDLLKEKGMTQRELASLLGKRESEISRWLTGTHGFTTTTLAKISAALGEPIVEVRKAARVKYIFVPVRNYVTPSEPFDGTFTNREKGNCIMAFSS